MDAVRLVAVGGGAVQGVGVAGGGGVDEMLHPSCVGHCGGGEEEAEGDAGEGGKGEAVAAEGRVQEVGEEGDEQDEG